VTEKRLLVLIATLIGLVGALLILVDAINALRRYTDLNWVLDHVLVPGILGVACLLGSLLIYRGRHSMGGILNVLLGIVVIVLGAGTTNGILVLISGVIGVVASETAR